MIKDLRQAAPGITCVTAQVCIIGAGTAGIFLAQELRRRGLTVVMLEAGDQTARTPGDVDQNCEQRGIRYRGAELGRSFGLGGTSVLWGGQMLPIARSDLADRSSAGFSVWPISYSELADYFPSVQRALGIEESDSQDDAADGALMADRFPILRDFGSDFELRLSTWLPFKMRNFAKGFAKSLQGDAGLTVWLSAEVVGLTPSVSIEAGKLETVKAVSPNGRTLDARAEIVVICAGALESTRLLLAHDEATAGSITAAGAPLGRYFSDHLSVPCGRFFCRDWRTFNQAVGSIFQRGLMRTPRLELSAEAQRERTLTSAFAHFSFITHGDTGFDVVRSGLRRRQGKQQPLGLTPTLLSRVVTDVSAMAYWSFVYKRLWFPRRADVFLQVDIEQSPNPDSRLSLSENRDRLGRKRLIIDWGITPEDVRVIRQVAELTLAAWRQSPLCKAADLQLSLPEQFDRFETLYDVYHPTGSLRMGASPADSVVDRDLRLWAMENCYVSTTAVFPSAGSANPGMTHLALTARLAAHIGARLGAKS